MPRSRKTAAGSARTSTIPAAFCCAVPTCTRRTEEGIVVFNAPGANAQAVKEQEICSLVMASRDILGSIEWVHSISGEGENIPALVEKKKASFTGPELLGKTLGVIGLGAVGALVANAGVDLNMRVLGYDPFLSVCLKTAIISA